MPIKKLKALLNDSIESRSRISLHPSFDDIDAQVALTAIERLEQIASDTQRLLDLANSAEKWKGIALATHGGVVSQIQQDKADAIAAEREACVALIEELVVCQSHDRYYAPTDEAYIKGINETVADAVEAIRTRGPALTKEQA